MNSKFLIEDKFKDFGVIEWGYTEESKPITLNYFENWIENGNHGSLKYLSDHRKDLRRDLKNIFPEFKSALVFLFDYSHVKKALSELNLKQKIASYAYAFEGLDYHNVLRERLAEIEKLLLSEYGLINFFKSIDAQPVLERDLAYRAGLGWFGKNSMLINQKQGSYFLIASLLLDKKIDGLSQNNKLEVDHCGTCTKCIDLCPTNAIDLENRTIVAEKCISTFTIEHFKPVDPPENIDQANGEIFGCDICQEVCPWNEKKLKKLEAHELSPESKAINEFFLERSLEHVVKDLESMSNREFKKKFKGTVFERTGRLGVLKNLQALK